MCCPTSRAAGRKSARALWRRRPNSGGRALIGEALLDEVTALVEWPVPIAGRFEERFLALPREVLISTLQEHQRYFPVEDSQGTLMPSFITVSNIESRDPPRSGKETSVSYGRVWRMRPSSGTRTGSVPWPHCGKRSIRSLSM